MPTRRTKQRDGGIELEALEARLLLAADLTTGLIAYWNFEQAGGTAIDVSGSATTHNGTLNNGTTWDAAGKFGQAASFDGFNDTITLVNDNEINLATATDRTVAFWFKADDVSDNTGKQIIFEEGAGTRGLTIYLHDGSLYVGGWNKGGGESGWDPGTFLSTAAVSSGQWHHVALTLSGGATTTADAFKGYLDGVEFGSGDGSQLWPHSGDIVIGDSTDAVLHDGASDHKAYAGLLDDGYIYNRALSATDISVLANTTPVASDDALSTDEDTALAGDVTTNDTDDDGDALLASLVAGPSNGSLTFAADGTFTYTPDANWFGTDSFSYQIDDGREGTDTATVTITVNAVNDKPIAAADSFSGTEDTAIVGDVSSNDSDADGDVLTASAVVTPSHGTLVLNADGTFTYTPDADWSGTDSFKYRQNDGTQNSTLTTVTLTISPANDPPVATDDAASTDEDVALNGDVTTNDSDTEGDALTASLVSGPSHGSLTLNADGTYSYTPNANWSGTDTFTYQLSDGADTSGIATVTITVNAVNDAPVASDDTFTGNEDLVLGGSVVANDSDVEGDALTAALVTGPTHGTLTLNADGSFTYTPDANWNGTDSFTYQANDGAADSGVATATLVINAVNDLPVAGNDSVSTNEDVALAGDVTANDSDAEGDALTATLVSGPACGTLTLSADGTYVYTPNANFYGNDSFSYQLSDGAGNSNVATVSITVTAVNDAPVANDDARTTDEDIVLAGNVRANDSDVDGGAISASVVTGPSHGTLVLDADGNFTYTPDLNYAGSDSFTYKLNDGTADSGVATVSITVASVNDSPVAAADAYTGNEDTAIAGSVLDNDTDVEGDALTATLVAGPTFGTLTFNADGTFTYTPNANWNGVDSFTYYTNDGTSDSGVATVTLTVNAVNDAPVVADDSFTTDEDVAVAGSVISNDSDTEGDALTATLVTGPSNGTLTFNADGTFTYTPDANWNGTDSFTYKVNDGAADSGVATATITVNAINDAPAATADAFTGSEDTPLSGDVTTNDSDVEGDALTATLVSGPSNGTLTFNADGTFTYTPNANWNGVDGFTYQLSDGTSSSAIVGVTLTIDPVNDAPVANNDAITTNEDVALAGDVTANDSDIDGDALSATLVSGPSNGSLTLNADGTFSYTPDANWNGVDSFTYKVNDGTADSGAATVSITVAPVNDAPVAANDSATGDEDGSLSGSVLDNDSDIEGDALTAALVTGPTHGTLTLNADGTYSYTPDANWNGTDSFTYQANDGAASSGAATVTLTVNAVNDAPTATDDAASTNEDVTLTGNVLANDSDVEGDALTVSLVSGPSNGTLTLNADGTFSYTPDADWNGVDSFTYRVNDGAADGNVATVTITVNPVNDAPSGVADSFTTDEEAALAGSVLDNDSDIDGDALTATLVAGPGDGTLTFNADGTFTYTPDADFFGTDSFTYRANDGTADGNVTTVTITVNNVNDAPTAAADAFSGNEDTPIAGDVTANDTDPDGDTLQASLVTGPANGTLTLNSDGTFSYLADADWFGVDSFTYQVGDGSAAGNTVTVTLTVNPVNDGPDAVDDSFTTDEEVALSGNVVANDSDIEGDAFTVSLVSGPANGTLTLNADGTFTYTPDVDFFGNDSFTYQADDGTDTGNVATVAITVLVVNDPPTAVDDAFASAEDAVLRGNVITNDTDPDGDTLSAELVTGPSHGTLTLDSDGSFIYTPDADWYGSDSFTYRAHDGAASSGIGTVDLTVTAVNDAPVIHGPTTVLGALGETAFSGPYRLSLSDVDLGSGAARVTLSATDGTFSLGSTSGLTFLVGDGADDTAMTFTGSLADINAALAGMTFSFDYYLAQLSLSVSDLGGSGAGGARTATTQIALADASGAAEDADADEPMTDDSAAAASPLVDGDAPTSSADAPVHHSRTILADAADSASAAGHAGLTHALQANPSIREVAVRNESGRASDAAVMHAVPATPLIAAFDGTGQAGAMLTSPVMDVLDASQGLARMHMFDGLSSLGEQSSIFELVEAQMQATQASVADAGSLARLAARVITQQIPPFQPVGAMLFSGQTSFSASAQSPDEPTLDGDIVSPDPIAQVDDPDRGGWTWTSWFDGGPWHDGGMSLEVQQTDALIAGTALLTIAAGTAAKRVWDEQRSQVRLAFAC